MKKITRIIAAVLLAVAVTVPLAGCDEGSSTPDASYIEMRQQAEIDFIAAEIDSACKDYYFGVKSGTITSADNNADGAAAPGAISSVRQTAADGCTIANAMKYSGTSDRASYLSQMSVTAEGTIFRTGNPKYTASSAVASISPSTTLGSMYKQWSSSSKSYY